MAERSAAKVYVRVFGVILLAVAAAAAGVWLAEKTVGPPIEPKRLPEPAPEKIPEPQAKTELPEDNGHEPSPRSDYEPPLFFFANTAPDADLAVIADEVEMAARNGIHQYVVSVELPWVGQVTDSAASLKPVEMVAQRDPEAKMLLRVAFDPPEAWLDAHPEAVALVGGQRLPYACLASAAWLDAAKDAFDNVAETVANSGLGDSVTGYVMACLEKGAWYHTPGYDVCEANVAGFRAWLVQRYGTDEALREAWANEEATLDTAAIPQKPDPNVPSNVFFAMPEEAAHVDFLAYVSETTADAIAALAAHIKGSAGQDTLVLAPYGYSFELPHNDAGHFALTRVIDSEVDGLVSPVSYADRGLGGTGGFMGPVSSARGRGKQWYIIDDTRTGIIRDAATGGMTRAKGVRADDVYSVQARNFAAALANGLGVFWADPYGEGELHEPTLWQRFGVMRDLYAQQYGLPEARPETGAGVLGAVTLAVVADETSRFYQRRDEKLNERLLRRGADAALRVGVSTRLYLLRDVIDGVADPASVYLFLNAFRLTAADRERLHEVLRQAQAAAIWLYAPGYIDETAAADNITATVRIPVKAFAESAKSGSVCGLEGKWFAEGSTLGETDDWSPLFYIDDDEANVLANYEDSGKPSVAMAFLDEGWVSAYVAEPAVSAALLREILHILGKRLNFRKTGQPTYDTTHFGRDLLAVHAATAGERTIYVPQPCNVRDLLRNEIGWQRKSSITLPMSVGETRLLQFTPVDNGARP